MNFTPAEINLLKANVAHSIHWNKLMLASYADLKAKGDPLYKQLHPRRYSYNLKVARQIWAKIAPGKKEPA